MQEFSKELHPNLCALDDKVRNMLASEEAKGWTSVEREEKICAIHPIYWMEEYGYIQSAGLDGESGSIEIMPFKLNPIQLQIADKICKHLIPSKWERVQTIILKHRKAGISTLIAGFDYWFMRAIKNMSAFAIADLSSHTDNISAMIELFHERDLLNPPVKVPLRGAKKGMKLSNGASVEYDSGENPNPGTSGTLQICHQSENAKWRDPLTSETSLLNSMPRKGFVFIVKESTAFGLNKFSQDCEQAESGKSNWEFIFVSWKYDPECEYPVHPQEVFEYTPQEQFIADTYGLRPGHIKFRRSQIELLGSEQQFIQDFPLNSREPFLITGSNFFDVTKIQDRINEIEFFQDYKNNGWDFVEKKYPEVIMKMTQSCPRGMREALSVLEGRNVVPQNVVISVNNKNITYLVSESLKRVDGSATMYRSPVKDHRYIVVVDVAEGIKTSEYTSDNSIIRVIDVDRKEEVLEWGGTFDEEMTANYAVRIAAIYNKGTIVPEMNNKCGGLLQANLAELGYRNIFHRESIGANKIKREFGWKTTVGNKKDTCGQLRQDFKNDMCLLHCRELLEEMLFFIDSNGRLLSVDGHNDDRIMTMSIGLKVLASTPTYQRTSSAHKKIVSSLPSTMSSNPSKNMRSSNNRSKILSEFM